MFLISENWLISDLHLGNQPFSLGFRFNGDRVTADFGAILVGELIDERFPIPWLSFSYHFGSSNGGGGRGSQAATPAFPPRRF